MALTAHYFFYLNTDDVIYDTLPLYHTAGGVLGTGQAIVEGCTVVFRKKFSASRFWDDCVKYNCSVSINWLIFVFSGNVCVILRCLSSFFWRNSVFTSLQKQGRWKLSAVGGGGASLPTTLVLGGGGQNTLWPPQLFHWGSMAPRPPFSYTTEKYKKSINLATRYWDLL